MSQQPLKIGRLVILFSLTLFVAILTSCSSAGSGGETRNDTDDAFAAPSNEAGAPIPDPNTVGAGDLGAPAGDLQVVYFPFDSSVISPEAAEALKSNSAYLRDNPTIKIQIEGHCDERGTVEYNLALGERRAKAAASRLKKLGVPASRFSTISYGKERPQDPGHDETAWSKNRRTSFVIVSQ